MRFKNAPLIIWFVAIVLVLVAMLFLSGCAAFDAAAGVRVGPGGATADPGGGIIGGIAGVASSLPGWLGLAGTLLGFAGTAYQKSRTKQYAQGLQAVVTGMDRALNSGELAQVSKNDLYAALDQAKKEIMSNPEALTKFVAIIKAGARA